MPAGPCVICGDTNYSLSLGGPHICPPCDCGNPKPKSKYDFLTNSFRFNALENNTFYMPPPENLPGTICPNCYMGRLSDGAFSVFADGSSESRLGSICPVCKGSGRVILTAYKKCVCGDQPQYPSKIDPTRCKQFICIECESIIPWCEVSSEDELCLECSGKNVQI